MKKLGREFLRQIWWLLRFDSLFSVESGFKLSCKRFKPSDQDREAEPIIREIDPIDCSRPKFFLNKYKIMFFVKNSKET